MIIDTLRRILQKEQFRPSLFGILVNPFYFARQGLAHHIAALAGQIGGRTLDIGCGQKPYEDLFHVTQYTGLELDTAENRKSKRADCYYDGQIFPFADNEFDSVVMSQVFEHVFNPDAFLNEVRRIMKTGGTLLLTVPFIWDEHEQPYDYARYSSFGLRAILEKSGFAVMAQRKSVADIRVIFQLVNGYIYKKTATGNNVVNLLLNVCLIAPFTIAGELLWRVLPKNGDLYLDNVILAKKVRDA